MTVDEYVIDRLRVLDDLIAMEPEGSTHRYALMAGKYELLLMTQHVTKGRFPVDTFPKECNVNKQTVP